MSKIGVDVDCVKLARLFIEDSIRVESRNPDNFAEDQQSLAEAIQAAIDDWFYANGPVSA